MARRRMIDPNFWQSENVARLTIRQRLLLIGLISNADDEGKLRGNPAFIRSIIFPYEDYKLSEIEIDLHHVEEIGTILRYEIDSNRYILMMNWNKFQRVDKPQKSMIPDPVKNYSKNHSDNDSKNDSSEDQTNSENDSCLKEKKIKEDKRREEKGNEDEGKGTVAAPAKNNSFVFFEQNGFGTLSPKIKDEINYWLDGNFFEEPNEIILKAMGEAVTNNARTWKYVEAILKNWSNKNLKTISSVEAHHRAYESNKSPKVNIKARNEQLPEYMVNQPKTIDPNTEEIDEDKKREVEDLLRQLGEIP